MTDLSTLSTAENSRKGVNMPICDFNSEEPLTHQGPKDKEPREMYLTLLGPESESVRRMLAQIQQRAEKNKDNHSPSDDDIAAELASDSKMLAKQTVGGLVFFKGEWVDVTSDNAAELYADLLLLRTQALRFMLDPKKFKRG